VGFLSRSQQSCWIEIENRRQSRICVEAILLFAHPSFGGFLLMQVTISGSIGRAPQSLPQTTDGLPVIEAALAVPTGDGKDWFALQFVGADLVDAAQVIRKGNTLAVTGDLTFEPLPDGSVASCKPVVAVSDLQLLC
jgi:hypothetical protein